MSLAAGTSPSEGPAPAKIVRKALLISKLSIIVAAGAAASEDPAHTKAPQEGLPPAASLLPTPPLLAAWRQASAASRYSTAGHLVLGLEKPFTLMLV